MKIFATAIAAACSLFLVAEEVFPEAFQRIGRMKNAAEAEKAYAELAQSAKKPVQRDAAFHAAAQKAAKAKNYENCERYIASISDSDLRSFATMEMRFGRRQFKQLVEESKGFKLEQWREDLIPEAAYMRAYCYAWMKKRDEALKDITLAHTSAAAPAAKYRIIQKLSNIYESFIPDNAAELALLQLAIPYTQSPTVEYFYRQRVVCRYAYLLGKTGKADEGIEFLLAYRGDKAASRVFKVKQTLGDLYAMKGDKEKAMNCYLEAKKVYPPWAKSIDRSIKALQQ